MKQLRIAALLPLLALLGCEPVYEQSAVRQIAVDSIIAPDTVGVEEAVGVAFYGTIGENRCWFFHEFKKDRTSPERLEMRVLVQFKQTAGSCAPGPVDLNGLEHTIAPPHPGTFRVVVIQPSGDSLVHVVNVR
jgi:hypothetical protein